MTEQTYNQEEVRELFDIVFKLSAKDITDKLIKARNRPLSSVLWIDVT